jgi:hypothetical protein
MDEIIVSSYISISNTKNYISTIRKQKSFKEQIISNSTILSLVSTTPRPTHSPAKCTAYTSQLSSLALTFIVAVGKDTWETTLLLVDVWPTGKQNGAYVSVLKSHIHQRACEISHNLN